MSEPSVVDTANNAIDRLEKRGIHVTLNNKYFSIHPADNHHRLNPHYYHNYETANEVSAYADALDDHQETHEGVDLFLVSNGDIGVDIMATSFRIEQLDTPKFHIVTKEDIPIAVAILERNGANLDEIVINPLGKPMGVKEVKYATAMVRTER